MRIREDIIPPICLDGFEDELAALIVDVHDSIILNRGHNPKLSRMYLDEMVGKVASAISSSFCSFFGVTPDTRYSDVFEQIADFAAHLSKDHIFPDGNKRTTVVSSLAILHMIGYTLDIDDPNDPERNILYQWIQDIVTGSKAPQELASVLREHRQELG